MRLLLDTDALCLLFGLDLFEEALSILQVTEEQVAVLQPAASMIRKHKKIRAAWPNADQVADRVASLKVLHEPAPDHLVDALTNIQGIDVGENLLFATLAGDNSLLLTGDKKAMKALANRVPGVAKMCAGRIVCVPQLIDLLVRELGLPAVQGAFLRSGSKDMTLLAVLGSRGDAPQQSFDEGIAQYRRDVESLGLSPADDFFD